MQHQRDVHPMHTASKQETMQHQANAEAHLARSRADADNDFDRGRDTDNDGDQPAVDPEVRHRMFQEHQELRQRIGKLEAFILHGAFDELDYAEKSDLREQLEHMRNYSRVLSRRLHRQNNA